jgi:hypothetical protein
VIDEDLKPPEAAKRIKVSEQTLANWRSAGTGPPYRKLSPGRGGRVRYPKDALEAWLDAQMCGGDAAA